MAPQPPKVLISYSHDSIEHERRVLELAERLRADGVDAQLDQYVAGTPAKGWPRWMEDQLDWVQFVLVICTETYHRRFLGREEYGPAEGVLLLALVETGIATTTQLGVLRMRGAKRKPSSRHMAKT
jgi:hypothetical protein